MPRALAHPGLGSREGTCLPDTYKGRGSHACTKETHSEKNQEGFLEVEASGLEMKGRMSRGDRHEGRNHRGQ